jgi:hypothetical protein
MPEEIQLLVAHWFYRSRIYYYIFNISIEERVFEIGSITLTSKNYHKTETPGNKRI